jgi:hypothetical protein
MVKGGKKSKPKTRAETSAERVERMIREAKQVAYWVARDDWLSGRKPMIPDSVIYAQMMRQRPTPGAPVKPKKQAPIKPVKKSSGRPPSQIARARGAIKKLFPKGLPHELSTAAVHEAVTRELDPESKRLGLSNPDVTTVARALGRR